ncbi:putative RNA-directed DNA polymerase, partial [Tanacetum coccineum]
MGNTGLSKIVSIGDICLLDEDGYHNSSGNGLWKVTLGSLIVARGKRESKLNMTHPKISKSIGIQVIHDTSEDLSKSIVNAIDNDDMTELWHKRLGKQTRRAFKSHPSFRTENILDLVHFDVCGPMKTKTLGGCSYFVTFIDGHSRKVWVYTLTTKDQVLDVFKQFHALVERQTRKKLKCIRSDNGGVYIGPFDAYCREHGIQHQKTPLEDTAIECVGNSDLMITKSYMQQRRKKKQQGLK